MTTLAATRFVIHLDKGSELQDRVRFTREPDEPGDVPHNLDFERGHWLDMGRPDTITVLVEPGDRLNPE